ncbi:MAG: hypothetical protein HY673_12010, partial [Chloroflexi bacterium]|nr:hypothetical protein [Chloroflexota bacterium]
MAAPRTDLAGNESLPRTITHFGDGSTALTNRDVSTDLANLDLALTALRDAIAGAGAGTKTLADVVTAVENLDLEVSDVASETTLALIKAKTDNLDLALSALRDVVRGAVVGATSSPTVAAGATVDVTYTPTAGKTARITAAWMWE